MYSTTRDRHHAITDPDEMVSVMSVSESVSDNWDEDIPSEGMKAKINRKCHVSLFFLLGRGDSLDYQSVLYFIFRIGPGVGVDHESRVGVGAGTAPPRLRTPDCCKRNC